MSARFAGTDVPVGDKAISLDGRKGFILPLAVRLADVTVEGVCASLV
jgi:hypothetical protein